MTLYDKLDVIADSYIPIIFLYSIYKIIVYTIKSKSEGAIKLIQLTTLISVVYIVQSIDNKYQIWLSYTHDYSTHTAFSLAIVYFYIYSDLKSKLIITASFLCYLLLMLYQKYHTITDILTTIAILSPAMYYISYYAKKQLTRRSNGTNNP